MVADHKNLDFNLHRALIFQGGGSLGAYEAGAYKDINEELSRFFRTEGRENELLFHIVSGTSIGAINAALLVSCVKENKHGKDPAKASSSFGNICPHNHLLRIYLTLRTIGILGVDSIDESLQESLPEDILPLKNLFSREFLTYLYPRHLC